MLYDIGDVLYYVDSSVNTFSRTKIKMVDADGVEWYRYDKPSISFTIEKHTIIGIVKCETIGRIPEGEFCETTYYTHNKRSLYVSEINNDKYPGWFDSEELAQAYLKSETLKYAD